MKNANRVPLLIWMLSSLVVLGTIIAAIRMVGRPSDQRQLQADVQRTIDLLILNRYITGYHIGHHVLPPSLDSLRKELVLSERIPRDPKTNAPYDYGKQAEDTFRLCAQFALPQTPASKHQNFFNYHTQHYDFRYHNAGKHCFTFQHQKDPRTLKYPLEFYQIH